MHGGSTSEQAGGTSAGTQRHPQDQAETPDPTPAPTSPGSATLLPNGKAKAPPGAPAAVKRALRAGNRLQGKPYRFGGGHHRWEDDAYDCSGATSYALRGIGGGHSPPHPPAVLHSGAAGAGPAGTPPPHPPHPLPVV